MYKVVILRRLFSNQYYLSTEIERIRPKITTESTKRLSDDGDLEKQKSKRKVREFEFRILYLT